MKITILYLIFATSLIVFPSCSENNLDEKNTREQEVVFDDLLGLEMLSNFYHEYIPLVENSLDFKEIEKLQKDNCSKAFYKEYLNWEIDYDPFINAQDSNSEWLNSLSIQRLNDRDKTYLVAYQYSDNSELSEIILTLDVIDGEYKIVGIDR